MILLTFLRKNVCIAVLMLVVRSGYAYGTARYMDTNLSLTLVGNALEPAQVLPQVVDQEPVPDAAVDRGLLEERHLVQGLDVEQFWLKKAVVTPSETGKLDVHFFTLLYDKPSSISTSS